MPQSRLRSSRLRAARANELDALEDLAGLLLVLLCCTAELVGCRVVLGPNVDAEQVEAQRREVHRRLLDQAVDDGVLRPHGYKVTDDATRVPDDRDLAFWCRTKSNGEVRSQT